MVSNALDEKWAVSEDAIANPVGDETVILHLGNGTYYGLDTIGSLLWEGLKEGKRPAEVSATILTQFDVDKATLDADLTRFLSELAEHDLVTKA